MLNLKNSAAFLLVGCLSTAKWGYALPENAKKRYGPLKPAYEWAERDKWLTRYDFGPNLGFGYINRDLVPVLDRVWTSLELTGLIKEITAFRGCYSPRPVSGTMYPSYHAYGLACDFNNGPFSEQFIRIWEEIGWCWGGRFSRPDPMHFSYKGEC